MILRNIHSKYPILQHRPRELTGQIEIQISLDIVKLKIHIMIILNKKQYLIILKKSLY